MEFDEDTENISPVEETGLVARLSKKTNSKEKASKTSKQTTLQFKAVAKKSKKNPWSDESEGFSDSEMDADDVEEEVVVPREKVERKTKAPVKYSMSDSEDEFDDKEKKAPKQRAVISDDDSSFNVGLSAASDSDKDSPAPPPKAPKLTKKETKSKSVSKQTKATSSSHSDDPAPKAPAQSKTKEATPKKAAVAKKPAASKKKAADVKQPSIMDALTKRKPASKPAAASKLPSFDSDDSEAELKAPKAKPLKRKQVVSEDSDSDSGNLMSRLKTKTNAGPKKPKKWDEDDSFLVSDQETASPVAAAPRDKAARARKPVNYNIDSDSDF